MTETRTARFSMPQWSAGTDSGSRLDFNEAFANLELWAARDENGTRAARPAAGIRGRYYTASDTKVIYRDNGTTWDVVGAVIEGATSIPAATSGVAQILKGLASQTGDLLQAQDSAGTVLSRIRKDGTLYITNAPSHIGGAGDIPAVGLAITAFNTTTVPLILRTLASQVTDSQKWQDSSGADVARMQADGTFRPKAVYVADTTFSGQALITKTYADANYASSTSGTVANRLSITGATPELQAPNVGAYFRITTSNAAAGDTEAMRITANGGIAIGGIGAAVVPLLVKGTASQTANATEWRDSASVLLASVSSAGLITANNFTTAGTVAAKLLRSTATAATDIVEIIKGVASHTANLTEWQSNTGTVLSSIGADGTFSAATSKIYSNGPDATNTMQALFATRLAAHRGIVVRGFASQTAPLQEWQDSGSTLLSRIEKDGSFYINGGGAYLFGAALATANTTSAQFTAMAAGHRALAVKGANGQTVDIFQVRDSTDAILSGVDSAGRGFFNKGLVISGSNAANGYTSLMQSNGNYSTLILRRSATQSGANLLDVQDESQNPLAAITRTGGAIFRTLYAGDGVPAGTNMLTLSAGVANAIYAKFIDANNSDAFAFSDSTFNALRDVAIGSVTDTATRTLILNRLWNVDEVQARRFINSSGSDMHELRRNGVLVASTELKIAGGFTVATGIGEFAGGVTVNNTHVLQTTSSTGKRLHRQDYTGVTTDATGFATITHTAGFTPTAVQVASRAPGTSFALFHGADTFSGTGCRLRFMNASTGGAYSGSTLAFTAWFWE